MPNPIFVIGSARNGTTWLSNAISNHPDISAVRSKAHWGLVESKIFENYQFWGNLKDKDNLIKFLESYSSSDYFRCLRGIKKYYYNNPPNDFYDFFFTLMDRFAERESSTYWLTKLDQSFYSRPEKLSEFLGRINRRYERPFFVGIKREFKDVVTSYVNMQGVPPQDRNTAPTREAAILLQAARYTLHYYTVNKIISNRDGQLIRFDDLRNRRKEVLFNVSNKIGVDFSQIMLEDLYPSNSSFRSKKVVKKIPKWELFLANDIIKKLLNRLTYLSKIIVRTNEFFGTNEPPTYRRILKLEHFSSELKEELENKDRRALLELLFD
jgi:hypothetical protein